MMVQMMSNSATGRKEHTQKKAEKMNFEQFFEKWIEENIETSEIYRDSIKEYVRELATVFMKQKHSGASASVTFQLFKKMMEDYPKS